MYGVWLKNIGKWGRIGFRWDKKEMAEKLRDHYWKGRNPILRRVYIAPPKGKQK